MPIRETSSRRPGSVYDEGDQLKKNAIIGIMGGEKGFAFIIVLFILMIGSAVSLAFLQKAGIGTSATVTRATGMQAGYLAESAANHALWRLLKENNFPAATDKYYMHSFAGGRYGYKVRRHTSTKFATIATVGALGDTVVRQSYVLWVKPAKNILTAYSDGTMTPKYRNFESPGWAGEASTLNVGNYARWIELAGKPSGKEMIMVTLDSGNDINVAVWDGSAWGNNWEFTNNSLGDYKVFDVAYERSSGEALVVGRIGTSDAPYYTVWDGNSWLHNPPLAGPNPAGGDINWIEVESHPWNDEILVAVLGDLADLELLRWDGDQFIDLGELTSTTSRNTYQVVDIAYEQQSGRALIVWGDLWGQPAGSSTSLVYAIWNGCELSAPQKFRDIGSEPRVFKAAADPTSDTVIVAVGDAAYDLHVNIWDGSAWSDYRKVATNLYSRYRQSFDVAWESSGNEALIVWNEHTDSRLQYMRWTKGTALSGATVQSGPDFGNFFPFVQAQAVPNSDDIIVQVATETSDLKHTLWDGNAFVQDPAELLNGSLYTITTEKAFTMAPMNFDPAPAAVTVLLEAHFDADEDGFAYADDTFRGTNNPGFASGVRSAAEGCSGGALKVTVGGITDTQVLNMSGGWQKEFQVTESGDVTLSFRYKLTLSAEYEADEFGQALVSVDGALYGEAPNDYLYQINGNGTGGSPDTSGWQRFVVNLGSLGLGPHTLILGGYNNKKTWNDETTEVLIDDVLITK